MTPGDPPGSARWLGRLATGQRRLIAEAALALAFAQSLGLLPALAFSIVIDKVVASQAAATMAVIAAALTLAAVCELAFSALRRALQAELRSRLSARAEGALFDDVVGLAAQRPGETGGMVAERLERLAGLRETLVESIDSLLVTPAMLAVIFALMVHFDPLMAAVVGVATLVHLALLVATRAQFAATGRAARDALARSRALASEFADGLATIRSFGAEARARAAWLEQSRAAQSASEALERWRGRLGGMATLKNRLLFVALLALGAFEVVAGRITVGGFVAFAMLLRQFSAMFEAAVPLWQRFAERQSWVERVGESAARAAAARPSGSLGHRIRGGVTLSRVGFGHERDRDILAGIDLEIRPGEAIGLAGPAGSGKSSLLRVMAGIAPPRRGTVAVDGQDLAALSRDDLHRSVRLVEQEPRLFPGSLLDNLRLGAPEAEFAAVEHAIRLAGAEGLVRRLPGGYAAAIDECRRLLSPGERQRLCLARALVGCPPVLLIDDPGAAIGWGEEAAFLAALAELRAERTLVLATGSGMLLAGMDRVVAIRAGRLAALPAAAGA